MGDNLVSNDTAQRIALAYREVEVAEKLLTDIKQAVKERRAVELRANLNLPYSLAVPLIEAHIAQQKAKITALSQKAISEAGHG